MKFALLEEIIDKCAVLCLTANECCESHCSMTFIAYN
jgi:hypothetical protein